MPQWNDQGADRGTMLALQQQVQQGAQFAEYGYYATSALGSQMSSLEFTVGQLTPPVLQYYSSALDGTVLEYLVTAVPNPGSHYEVWGWCSSTSAAVSSYVQLRSGTSVNDASSVPLKDITYNVYNTAGKRPIGPACSVNIMPGMRALWRTRDDEAIVVKKDTASLPHDFELWYRTVPN